MNTSIDIDCISNMTLAWYETHNSSGPLFQNHLKYAVVVLLSCAAAHCNKYFLKSLSLSLALSLALSLLLWQISIKSCCWRQKCPPSLTGAALLPRSSTPPHHRPPPTWRRNEEDWVDAQCLCSIPVIYWEREREGRCSCWYTQTFPPKLTAGHRQQAQVMRHFLYSIFTMSCFTRFAFLYTMEQQRFVKVCFISVRYTSMLLGSISLRGMWCMFCSAVYSVKKRRGLEEGEEGGTEAVKSPGDKSPTRSGSPRGWMRCAVMRIIQCGRFQRVQHHGQRQGQKTQTSQQVHSESKHE